MWTKIVGDYNKSLYKLSRRFEEEVGSAEEQPASNRIDTCTV